MFEEMRGMRDEVEGEAGVTDPELLVDPRVKGGLRLVDVEYGCGILKDNLEAEGFVKADFPALVHAFKCDSDLPRTFW
jgi:hypothetical protein